MNFQKKILIIDSDQTFRDEIKKSPLFDRYNVRFAPDGQTGIEKALEFNPDLIFCDTNIEPIDGYQVFKILRDSFLLKEIPFIFLKYNAGLGDFRYGMNLGADDFLAKPVDLDDLAKSIEMRFQKYKANSGQFAHEFNTLFELSPNGIIVFSQKAVLRANGSLKTLLKTDKRKPINIKIDDLFESSSLQRIKNWMQLCLKNDNLFFNDPIILNDFSGGQLKMNLVMASITKHPDFAQFIGFFTSIVPINRNVSNDQVAIEVVNLLKREKIVLAKNLEERITKIIRPVTVNSSKLNNPLFTKRENQVLCLSLEGLPIKIIADKLSISTRTVEKYRTKLMKKSGANNIVEVIVFSLKNGLIKI